MLGLRLFYTRRLSSTFAIKMKSISLTLLSAVIASCSSVAPPAHQDAVDHSKLKPDTLHANYSGHFEFLDSSSTYSESVRVLAYGDDDGRMTHSFTHIVQDDLAVLPKVKTVNGVIVDQDTGTSAKPQNEYRFVRGAGFRGLILGDHFYLRVAD